MKAIRNYIPAFLIFLLMASCTMTQKTSENKFLVSTVVPAAEGTVKIKKDKNNNFDVKIDIWNLAPPDQLSPPKQNYVVWVAFVDQNVKNVGQIVPQKSLSKVLKATIQTVSPTKPSKVFITTEDSINAQTPSDQIILTTDQLK